MKKIVLIAAQVMLMASVTQAAQCTTAKQNWESGSRTTCPTDFAHNNERNTASSSYDAVREEETTTSSVSVY